MARIALASRLYPPLLRRDLKSTEPLSSTSQRLMLENGLIEHAGSVGLMHVMPMAMRALDKLCRIISREMDSIGAYKIQMPSLCDRNLFECTDRLTAFGHDLFKLTDRLGGDYCLAPTHEESITHLVANRLPEMSAASAPVLLYQITSKFRDEMKSRYGLLRCREFLMKDLYSFDLTETGAKKTYESCLNAYDRILRIRLAPWKKPFMRVLSDVGAMGGSLSHEYHLENDCGEDEIDFCTKCDIGVNRELVRHRDDSRPTQCSNCKSDTQTFRTVEVAHAFLLGTKYSDALNARFTTTEGRRSAYMGSYGIGITRLLAALIDCNLNKRQQIRWPLAITPYTLCVIGPKAGSKEDTAGAMRFTDHVLEALGNEKHLRGEIIYDDRTDMTVGKRLVDAKKVGYPYIVVANKSVVNEAIPKFEFFDLTRDDGDDKMELITHEMLFSRMRALNDSPSC